jgi:chaperone required for assembly of F1-ATPase
LTHAPALPRRFYESASVTETASGFGVSLDARTLRTPGGAVFVSPTRALAQLCAEEWHAQSEHILPASMPASQLAFATLDWATKRRAELTDYVAAFCETDLCCHRAEAPVELVARQAKHWDPIVTWAGDALGVRLAVVSGIIAAPIEPQALATLGQRAAELDDFKLTALAQATGLAGSVLIGFALAHLALGPEEAFQAAALDNLWTLEHWGDDEEARARLELQRGEFHAITRFIKALQP